MQAENNLRGGDGQVTMDNAWVKGPVLGATTTIGRFDYCLNYGLMLDSTLNGVNFEVGNLVKANVFYGKDNNTDAWGNVSEVTGIDHLEVTGLGLKYATSKATTLNGGYYQFKDKDETGILNKVTGSSDNKAKVWEAGFTTKLNPDWSLSGAYGQSDARIEDTAYFAEVAYKGADKSKVGSYGAWVNYRHLERFAAPKATFDGAYTGDGQFLGGGAKGYEVGFNYTPMLNTVLRVKYVDLKPTSDILHIDNPTKFFQAQAEFFF